MADSFRSVKLSDFSIQVHILIHRRRLFQNLSLLPVNRELPSVAVPDTVLFLRYSQLEWIVAVLPALVHGSEYPCCYGLDSCQGRYPDFQRQS